MDPPWGSWGSIFRILPGFWEYHASRVQVPSTAAEILNSLFSWAGLYRGVSQAIQKLHRLTQILLLSGFASG